MPKGADEPAKLAALNKALFEERGFHGSRGDYYHKSNSYLNEVIDDREGCRSRSPSSTWSWPNGSVSKWSASVFPVISWCGTFRPRGKENSSTCSRGAR